jgi:hypothetical protein
MTKRDPTKTQERPPVFAPAAGADPNGRSSERELRPASLKALESLVDKIFFRLTPEEWGTIADDWFGLLEEWQLLHPDKLPAELNAGGCSPAESASDTPRNELDFALRLFAEDPTALAAHRAVYGEEAVLAFIAITDQFSAGRADSLVRLLTKAYSALHEGHTRARDALRERTGALEEANRFRQKAKPELEARARQKAALDNGGRANGAAENRKRKAVHVGVVSRLYDECIKEHQNWPLKRIAQYIYDNGQLKKNKKGDPIKAGTIESILKALRRGRRQELYAPKSRPQIHAEPARSTQVHV